MDGPESPPSFEDLFADAADEALRREAHIAVAGIPASVDLLVVRGILATARHRERIRRMLVNARQDDGLQRAPAGAVKYVELVLKHFDPVFRPQTLQPALADLRLLTLPLVAPGPEGHPTLPHYTEALAALLGLRIDPDDARAMLRGVGINVRITSDRRPVSD